MLGNSCFTPQFPYFASRKARVKSFVNWPMDSYQDPEKLADAGFFYLGWGDRTMCYYCGGGLEEWTESDDPWREHLHYFTLCPYIYIKKKKMSNDVLFEK